MPLEVTIDSTTWAALALTLTIIGGALSWVAWRRRGLAAGLRGLAWTLVPVAAWLTGTLKLAVNIINDVGDWATKLVFSPAVWIGIIVAGGSAALFVISGQLRSARHRRTRQGSGARHPQGRATAGEGSRSRDREEAAEEARSGRPRQPGRHRGDPEEARHLSVGTEEPRGSDAARYQLARRLNHAVAGLEDPATPMMVVDLDAFDANAADLVRRAAGKPIRVASKSLRIPALLERALAEPGFAGVLAYSLREALWLVRNGITDDVVMGYPTVDRGALRRPARRRAGTRPRSP